MQVVRRAVVERRVGHHAFDELGVAVLPEAGKERATCTCRAGSPRSWRSSCFSLRLAAPRCARRIASRVAVGGVVGEGARAAELAVGE